MPLPADFSRVALISASRWPSVDTRLNESGRRMNSAPFRKYRVSSPVIANCVFAIIWRSASRGSMALYPPVESGRVGKSSRGSVCIRESKRSAATLTPFLSSSIRTSVSGSALMISNSFFAGSVNDPPLATDAVHLLRSPTSRSVASSFTSSPAASMSTFARIGIVFFRSTMPWKSCNSRKRSVFRTTSSMCW